MSEAPRVNRGSSRKRPRLGQNLLTDPGAAERIVAALGDVSLATVVEIGTSCLMRQLI